MIKAVIFDWGGVLIDNPSQPFKKYCADYLGVKQKKLCQQFDKYIDVFQKGKISEVLFWERVCKNLNINKPQINSLWSEAFKNVYCPKREMFKIVSQLKKNGYKIGFLSNTEIPTMRFFVNCQYKQFDVAVFSCQEGIRKPAKKIYKIVLKKLKVKPKEAIFIDDAKENIKSAQKLGIKTILFKNPKQVRKKLDFLLSQ